MSEHHCIVQFLLLEVILEACAYNKDMHPWAWRSVQALKQWRSYTRDYPGTGPGKTCVFPPKIFANISIERLYRKFT